MNIPHLLADEERSKEVGLATKEASESISELLVFQKRQSSVKERERYQVISLDNMKSDDI